VSVHQQPALLFTPGPLTTSADTKSAMQRDWGSRDAEFVAMNARVRDTLLALANATDEHVCVPMQGSGTFAVEATLGTLIGSNDHLLICINGAYGKRMATMLTVHGRRFSTLEWSEDQPVDANSLDDALASDSSITHVAVVHCETTSGVLNPIETIASVCAKHQRSLLIDAMSSFGALPIDATAIRFDALMASSNKCLEGVPGLGFAIVRRSVLEAAAGNSPSLSLDLHGQWQGLENNGQWRFTPPTHVIAALDSALGSHAAEGGVAGRGARYQANCDRLVAGMQALGFEPLLPSDLQAPIIVTFHMPSDPAFVFEDFYAALAERDFLIYPGKLTVADSFRVGCIGQLHSKDIDAMLDATAQVLTSMGIKQRGRAARTDHSASTGLAAWCFSNNGSHRAIKRGENPT
jgi:2-aminoethylphosphonate-pyruvate transaminase